MAETGELVTEHVTTAVTTKAVDWELGKIKWLQGITSAEIGKALGVSGAAVRQHAIRHKWHELKARVLTVSMSHVETKATSLRSKLTAKTEKAIEALPDKYTPSTAKAYAGTVLDLARAGSLLEGWSDQQSSKVDIHMLASGEEQLLPQAVESQELKHALVEPLEAGETGVTPFPPAPVD